LADSLGISIPDEFRTLSERAYSKGGFFVASKTTEALPRDQRDRVLNEGAIFANLEATIVHEYKVNKVSNKNISIIYRENMMVWKINHKWGKNREINPSQVPRGLEGVAGHE